MPYAIGHNISGYLPEADVHYVRTFEEAKAILLSELKYAEEYAETEELAEDLSAAQQEVNLWSGADSLFTATRDGNPFEIPTSWWINEVSNAEYFQGVIPTNDDDSILRYAWPGGYEVFYVADDGGVICADCVADEGNPAHADGVADGWRIEGYDHTGNTDALTVCDHCGRVIVEED